jgi:TetR/AcrR family transcriptional regulator
MNMDKQMEKGKPLSSGERSILKAAETLFAEKGYDAVSMSAIAQQANTSKPNIYHHFKNKHELYLAIMKKAVQRSTALLDALESDPGTVGEHLSEFASAHLDNILEHKSSTQLVLRDALSGGSTLGREIAQHFVPEVFTRLVTMVESGQQRGEFKAGFDPRLVAFMIVAANSFFFQASPVMHFVPEADFSHDPARFSSGMTEILFNGILSSPGEEQ